MGLVVGQYYRGDIKQKPKQWGSKSFVRGVVMDRISALGLDPELLLAYTPVWEGCKQAGDIMGVCTPEGSQSWKNWATQSMDGVSQHLGLSHPDKFCNVGDDYSLIFWLRSTPIGSISGTPVIGLGRGNIDTSGVCSGLIQSTVTANRFAFYVYPVVSASYFTLNKQCNVFSMRQLDAVTYFSLFADKEYKDSIINSRAGYTYDMVHIRAGCSLGGDRPTSTFAAIDSFYGALFYRGFIPNSINAALSDYPYQLIRPPTFRTYFDLAEVGQYSVDLNCTWKIKNELSTGSTWKIIKSDAANFSWKVFADINQISAWKILTEETTPSSWKIFKRLSSGASWAIANRLSQDTAWKILSSETKLTSWRVLTEKELSAAWKIFSSEDIETAWRILTTGELSQDLAWRILSDSEQHVSWRILCEKEQETSFKIFNKIDNAIVWKIQTGSELSIIWKIFSSDDIETSWKILTNTEFSQDIAWKIKTLTDKITGWKVRYAENVDSAWKIINEKTQIVTWNVLRISDQDLAYKIFSELEQDTSWVIGDAETMVPGAVYEFFQPKRNFMFNATTRTLIFYQKEK